MSKINMLITLEQTKHSDLEQMAHSLENKGLEIQKLYRRSGTISALGESSLMEALKAIEGVEEVRPEGKFQLPPMNEKIPQ